MKAIKRDIFHLKIGASMVSIDTNFFPIVPVWWGGTGTTQIIDKFWELRDDVMADIAPLVVMIHDIEDVSMDAITRKHLAEKAKTDPRIQSGQFMSAVIVTGAVIRGVMTAVTWVAGDKFPMEYVSNVDLGFKAAQRLLEKRDATDVVMPEGSYTLKKNPAFKA